MKSVVTGAAVLFCCLAFGMEEITAPPAPFAERSGDTEQNLGAEFRNEGIYKGEKSLIWVNGEPHASLIFQKGGQTIFELRCRISPTVPSWSPFTRFQDQINRPGKQILRTHRFQLSPDSPGVFQERVTLNREGNIVLDLLYECNPEKIKGRTIELFFPLLSIAGRTLTINGREVKLPERGDWSILNGKPNPWIHGGWFPKVRTIRFFPENPADAFSLELDGSTDLVIFRSPKGAHFSIRPKSKQDSPVRLILDPGESRKPAKTENIVNGINFTRNNGFHVSLFDPEHNFFLNPSFESDSRYFEVRNADLSSWISTDTARSGRRSMLLKGTVSTFSFPIRQRCDYTLSCYVKSGNGTEKTISIGYRSYENQKDTQKKHYFKIRGNDWTRLEVPVNLPRSGIRFEFSGRDVYLDDIQFERGKKASAYAGNPFGLQILTDSPDRSVVKAGTPIHARLSVRGPAGSSGKINLTVTDFFKRIRHQKSVSFRIPDSGETVLPLAPDGIFTLGPNVIRADVRPDGHRPYTDFLRITVMKYADNTAKNKNIHGTAYYGYNYIYPFHPPARELHLLRIAGIGAHSYLSNHKSPGTFALLRKYGMDSFGSYIERGNYNFQQRKWDAPIDDALRKAGIRTPIAQMTDFSPEVLNIVTETAYQIVKAHPHVKYWTAHTEPSGHHASIKAGKIQEFAKYILALNRGIMRANPNAVFNPFGDCGMGKGGRENVLNYLKACRELEPQTAFRVLDIHTYREFPELPDTEYDLKAFLDALAELGYKDVPIHLGEGAYWVPIIVKEWLGIAPWQDTTTKDRYGLHVPSYDLGWGEQVSAAMILRHWLVAYKYRDRVKFTCPWVWPFLDSDQPFAWLVMSSNLTDLLGNAVFREDIRFFPGARAYLFEDPEGRPVAAYWYFEESLDRGLQNGFKMELPAASMDLEYIDIMGNVCQAQKSGTSVQLPLSNYPVFIRGRKGDMKKLSEAFRNIRIPGAKKLPVELIARGISDGKFLHMDVLNLLSRRGEYRIRIGAGAEQALDLNPNECRQLRYPLPSALRFDQVNKISIPVSLSFGEERVQSSFDLDVLPLHQISGKIDWSRIPSIRLPYCFPEQYAKTNQLAWKGEADLSGTWQAAWSPDGLFLRFVIRDDHFVMDHTSPRGVSAWYDNDSIQLFFDTLGDGRANARRGNSRFDQNDYSYELLPTGENSAIVYRRHAPDQQLTGGLDGLFRDTVEKNVRCAFAHQNGRMIYEVFFPARYLQPMEFHPGSMPGLGIKVFDRDNGDRCAKQILSNVDGDVFKRTDIYPLLLFMK